MNDNETKPNLKKWLINYKSHNILVTNWWHWISFKGSADLYIDDVHCDQNTDMLPDISKPFLSARSISPEIDTIDVYYAGFFTVKISIQINGENIFQDRLNFFDKLALKS